MKRLLSFAALLSMMMGTLVSCSDDANGNDITPTRNIKESELFVYSGDHLLNAGTRAAYKPGQDLGYNTPDDGCYHVYYYIRIDNNMPGEEETNLPASAYFPRTTANKSLTADGNHGLIWANADWKQCKNFSKYIWSPDGSAIQSIIVEEPSIEQLILADKGHNNDGTPSDFTGLLAHKDELHFLWYACKKQDSDHVWHIDGILTTKDRTNINETAYGKEITDNYNGKGMVEDYGSVKRTAHVEVDIHQQEHKDWNEIKTSIHLRDTVAAEVFLPIDYQAQADDFDIRVGRDFEYVTELKQAKVQIGEETYNLTVSIKHEPTGIRIRIEAPDKQALRDARTLYGDGITFEIHSYVTSGIPQETIWEKLKKSTCKVTPTTHVFGQITSAFYEDRKDF